MMHTIWFDSESRRAAKVSYVARRLADVGYGTALPAALYAGSARPRSGDLALCRVTKLGQHRFLGQVHGRRSQLFPDDEIVVAFGARYAPDQFEAEVPEDLGPCELAAGGGIAARIVSAHSKMAAPTRIEPVGLLRDEHGAVLNLRALRRPSVPEQGARPRTIAVLGTAMNAGKTTVAGALVRGLTAAGLRAGAAKVTGTGAPGDPSLLVDAGAVGVVDFTDFGYATTYRLDNHQVLGIMRDAITELAHQRADVLVIEVADGLLQRETAALIDTPQFRSSVDTVVFAAADSISAVAGLRELRALGLPVVALSGVVTASRLAMLEVAGAADVPVYESEEFASPLLATSVLRDAVRTAPAYAGVAGPV
jgi:hypothetical protein